jgi:hypothetical protein
MSWHPSSLRQPTESDCGSFGECVFSTFAAQVFSSFQQFSAVFSSFQQFLAVCPGVNVDIAQNSLLPSICVGSFGCSVFGVFWTKVARAHTRTALSQLYLHFYSPGHRSGGSGLWRFVGLTPCVGQNAKPKVEGQWSSCAPPPAKSNVLALTCTYPVPYTVQLVRSTDTVPRTGYSCIRFIGNRPNRIQQGNVT